MGVMGKLGTKVMVAAHRDLTAGAPFLKQEAQKAGVTVLSANLTSQKGQPFASSVVKDVGGLKVAFVGLSPPGPVPGDKELKGALPLEAARAALKGLKAHDLTVLLAATPYADTLQMATELKGQVDFVVQSGEPRGTQPPQNVGGVYVLSSGQKGQAVGKLALDVSGPGEWLDLAELERDKQQLTFLEGQVKVVEDRIAAAKDPQAKADLTRALSDMKKRRDEQAQKSGATRVKTPRELKLSWSVLTADVKDDAALKAEVEKLEPLPPPAH
jgi:2',3'-cyclic-nucleotide 2'-phosphodiesterase (5'-nucleotidase family)